MNIWDAVQTQDVDGGPQYTYPSVTRANVPASCQAGEVAELIDEQGRVTRMLEYKVVFAFNPGVTARDQITFTDSAGQSHILFAQATRDEAGRGSTWIVRAIEKL